jgi:PAS domain S-box-containing protein
MPPLSAYQKFSRSAPFRMMLAMVFGLIGFSLNFLDIQILDTAEFKISILIGLFFPLIISLAWGWRYGLLSALAGGTQSMWWLWYGDGWGILYAVPIFTLWIVWHGWWADVRQHNGYEYPWYHSAFAIEVPFRIVSELGFLTIFAALISCNPPPWAPEITWDHVSLGWITAVAVKHTISGYILLMTAYVVLSLGPVRNALGLQMKYAQSEVSILYVAFILVGLMVWGVDSFLHYWLDNNQGAGFWQLALFSASPHLFMRIAFLFLALCGVAALTPMLRNRARLQKRLMYVNYVLDAMHQVSRNIDRFKEPHELIGVVCDQLIHSRAYLWACILLVKGEETGVGHGLACSAGDTPRNRIHFQDTQLCPCARRALESRDLVITDDHAHTCEHYPLHHDHKDQDGETGCFTCPIAYRETVYGVITVSLPLERLHEDQEQFLFKEICSDIAFALHGLEEEKKRCRAEAALRESEQRFSRMLENVPEVAIQGYGSDGTVHYWNQASEIIYGYTREEAIGKNLLDLIIPEHMRESVTEVIAKGAREGQMPPPQELTLTNKRGEPITVLSSHAVIVRDGHEPEFYCIDIDLRKRKQTESRLMASQAEIQSIFRSAPVGIGLVKNRVLMRVNKRLCEMLGYEEEELVGKSARMVYPSLEEFERVGSENYGMIKQTGTGTMETRFMHKNGSILHIILSSTPLDLHDPSRGITFTALDISDRKRAEDALRQSQEHLRTTLYSIGDAVITTDNHCRVTSMNPVAETLTGWDRDEAKGLPLRTVFPIVSAIDRTECENPATRAMEQEQIVGLANHTVLIAKDGSEHHIADSAAPIRDLQGTITGAVLVFRDVTREYRMRKELQKMDKLESLGNLAGGLAHDFNNILMAIYGNIELATSTLDTDHPAREFLTNAGESMDRATRITNKLLTFSKGGSPIKQHLSMDALIRDTVGFDLSGSGVKAVFDVPDNLLEVEGDKAQLEQVVSNLTLNAKQAMENEGTLHVSLINEEIGKEHASGLKPGAYVKIVFEDTGPGIAPEHIGSVFDPYFTTHQTGSGLGLATVYSIVTKHGGAIFVESPAGQGARFTLHLPATGDSGGFKPHPVPGTDEPAVSRTSRQIKRILIMDDEPMILELLTALLKSLNYEVEIATDGNQAVEVYRQALQAGTPFDAVILDLTIPGGMGGAKAIKKLLEIDPAVRGIVSSGYADDPIIARYQDYGFKGVAIKPYSLQELRDTVEKVVSAEK